MTFWHNKVLSQIKQLRGFYCTHTRIHKFINTILNSQYNVFGGVAGIENFFPFLCEGTLDLIFFKKISCPSEVVGAWGGKNPLFGGFQGFWTRWGIALEIFVKKCETPIL